jgi:HK97 family phage major capsid protein
MDYIKTQLEERAKAYEAAKEILDHAAAENRSLDATERESVDRAFADMDQRKAIVEDMRALEARKNEVAAVVAGHDEVRALDSAPAEQNDADVIRSMARGELRSATFEKRDVTKGSTGAPVPTSFYNEVLLLARAVGPMLDVSTVLNTAGGENLQIPSLSAYSVGTVTAEASTIGESDPTMQAFVTLGAYKYSFLTQVSTELIEDAGVDVIALIGANVGNALGYAVNTALTTGTGTVMPKGIVAAASAGITGSTAVAGAFTYENLVDLAYSADAAARMLPGFGYMASGNAIAAMRKIQDGSGAYVFQPSLSEGTPDRVLGFPLIENPAMAAVGATNVSVIAGHFPSYFVRTVGGIRLDRSDDYAFADGLVTFRATFRADGNLPIAAHVKKFTGGAA